MGSTRDIELVADTTNYHGRPNLDRVIFAITTDPKALSARQTLQLGGDVYIEGVDARMNGQAIEILLVTDADDSDIAAALYRASVPAP